MASPVYRLFEQAMRLRKQIVCIYRGRTREICPVILGHTDGHEVALTYQFAGASNSRLPPGGQWRCLSLSEVNEVTLRDGPWLVGTRHARQQSCVQDVDLDVNPDSPYRPKRPLKRR
jgi:predicted DNA-binding transcriptional regulator YafY